VGFGLLIILLLTLGFWAGRRKTPPAYQPDLATFLSLLASRGGVVAEDDELLDDHCYEQALELDLISVGGGWSIHAALTGRGRRFLRAHRRLVAEQVKSTTSLSTAEATPRPSADRRKTSMLEKEW
jgi:hypothetical protein